MSLFVLVLLFLPGYIANGAPPVLARIPGLRRWNTPVDFGLSMRGKRLLGPNKTWRGVILGSAAGGLLFLILRGFASPESLLAPYASLPWHYGFLLGLGVLLLGDCGESFIKRRLGKDSGEPWMPFDQIDYTIGGLAVMAWWYFPSIWGAMMLMLFNAAIAAIFHDLGYRLGISKQRF